MLLVQSTEVMSYLDELNGVQRDAVVATEGPVMIIAGAGSGKTRVLTYRIAHLVKQGVDPFNILALTFTNKAAREMKERIMHIVGSGEDRNLSMGTFHSVFAKILRVEAQRLGYPANFTIYDTDDSKSLIRTILKEQGLDEKIYKPSAVLNRISEAKNLLISPEAYNSNPQTQEADRMSSKPKMGLVYSLYANRCFKAGAMDFDDLLFKTNILLRDFPDALHKYQHKFKYILVDEYQDTNFSQYVIIRQLAAAYRNICVVGDDAQSIYAFRGANIQNILNFEKDYPELQVFKLEQNYRSTKTIVGAANDVIKRNKEQLKKDVWTDNEDGEPIKVLRANTDNEEGSLVASSIFETKMNERAQNSDFAILYRTNAQSRAMEEALRKMNIPYRIYGGVSFYQRKEIKDLLAYFNLTINNHNEEALKRVINYPARGIGNTTVEKLIIAANDHNVSVWTVIENINEFNLGFNSGTLTKIDEFATMIKSFAALTHAQSAFELANHIATTSGLLRELYADKTPEGVSRHENIQELLNGIKEFCEHTTPPNMLDTEVTEALLSSTFDSTDEPSPSLLFDEDQSSSSKINPAQSLPAFMQDIALLTDADKNADKEEDKNKVVLMTVHAAKGLEFPYVYVAGLEENLFPSQLSLNAREDLEEERRLFYVAITRAQRRAVLSYAQTRYRWGNLIYCEPSRFLEEISSKFKEEAFSDYSDRSEPRMFDVGSSFNKFSRKPFERKPTSESSEGVKKTSSSPNITLPRNLKKISPGSMPTAPDTQLSTLQAGMVVEHEKFGTGNVLQVEGLYPNSKATVQFQQAGIKQLLLKFAKLKIVG